jgi:hypothetical protein
MTKAFRASLIAGVFAILLLGTNAVQVPTAQRDRGQEWLSWSSPQRNVYIDGFVTGFTQGTHGGCATADDLFERGQPHALGDQPSTRCLKALDSYSKDPEAYAAVITSFYTQHPEYQRVPFFYLLRFLSDRQFKTADQLYQMALKGELRTNF